MNKLSWLDSLPPEFKETATIAVANPSETVSYRISDFGTFTVVCTLFRGKGTLTYNLAEGVVSLAKAKTVAEADWNSGTRTPRV
jgi:hypothetical protein